WLKANLPVEFASFPKKNIEKFIMIKTKNRKPISNVALRYFKAAERFNISYDEQGLDFFFPMIFNFDNYLPPQFIAFAIGGTYSTKKYPREYVVEFCKLSPLPVVILGGESEKNDGEYISEQVGDKVINFCGKLSITESAYVLNNSQLVISNDTGMMHLAAAFHKPMISIWGNTVPEFGMYPLYPINCDTINVYFQNNKISCRPCSKLGYSKCPKKHFDCMMRLKPDELNDLCYKMLQ
ncbi:MAG TPA: glycosyltransferase family 9 protein, partial [Bacteroidales bacterium]|nr:glycosyltransferase family 9 protein [Bacteroidales bacterium]